MNHIVKPIRTDAEHDATLVEIHSLWGMEAGTPAGDRLDVLVALVEAYERQQSPLQAADLGFRWTSGASVPATWLRQSGRQTGYPRS